MYYRSKIPVWIPKLFPQFTWHFPGEKKELYLTFDDGPHPQITPWVLDTLKEFEAKATFFCVGDNVLKYPEVVIKIDDSGHGIGNHTQNHLDGWKTPKKHYLDNILLMEKNLQELNIKSSLFRPPYGKINLFSIIELKNKGKKIVMWDVLSGDFDQNISKEQCLANITNNVNNGSIVVLHDSLKAKEKLYFVLPKILKHFKALGYTFSAIPH